MSKKLRYYGKWGVLLTHSRSSLSFDKTNKGLWNPRLLGRRTSGPDPRTLVRFPNCHECHSRSKWVGEPDYTDPDPTKKNRPLLMQCTDRKEGRSQLLRLCSSLLAPYSVDDWRAWWEDDTYSNKFVPNLMLVSRPTRWSLWYWHLDVYVDHLYFQIQVTEKYSMNSILLIWCQPATHLPLLILSLSHFIHEVRVEWLISGSK